MFQREEHYQTGSNVSHFYGFSGLGPPEIVKLLPAAHKRIRKRNSQKGTDMASDPSSTSRQALSARNKEKFSQFLHVENLPLQTKEH